MRHKDLSLNPQYPQAKRDVVLHIHVTTVLCGVRPGNWGLLTASLALD